MSSQTPDQPGSVSAVLTPAEFALLEAIAGRIVPTTDTPGAIEAGAAHYIDRALADAYREHLALYRQGLAALDRYCGAALGRSFGALDAERQDAVLEKLEAGTIAELADGAKFFDLVRRHVMEGFFCEPHYGGNRDMVGWKLVGFPGQRHGYDDAYVNRVVDLAPVAAPLPPRQGE